MGPVEAVSQKKPAVQFWAYLKSNSTTLSNPVPAVQYVPARQGYGRRVVSFLNGSDVTVPLLQ